MYAAYAMFAAPDNGKASPPPPRWSDEQMIFTLCEGDLSKRDFILDNISYKDAVKWLLLKRYQSYAERMAYEK